jgi:hypothetical protein
MSSYNKTLPLSCCFKSAGGLQVSHNTPPFSFKESEYCQKVFSLGGQTFNPSMKQITSIHCVCDNLQRSQYVEVMAKQSTTNDWNVHSGNPRWMWR